jgi:hypothetical protein
MSEVDQITMIFNKLEAWASSGLRSRFTKTVKGLASKYQGQLFDGKNADGSNMFPLRESTLKGPIRREGNNSIRESHGNTPLFATGETADSIQGMQLDSNTWEIRPTTQHGADVLESNAKTSHGGFPFYGDTNKVVRDPLTVADPQMDYVEEDILKDLERTLNSL